MGRHSAPDDGAGDDARAATALAVPPAPSGPTPQGRHSRGDGAGDGDDGPAGGDGSGGAPDPAGGGLRTAPRPQPRTVPPGPPGRVLSGGVPVAVPAADAVTERLKHPVETSEPRTAPEAEVAAPVTAPAAAPAELTPAEAAPLDTAAAAEAGPAPAAESAPQAKTPRRGAIGRGSQASAADFALMRTHSDVRARVIAALLAPFVVYAAVMYLIGSAPHVALIWIWIPLVTAGVLAGSFLDAAHRRYRAPEDPEPPAAESPAAESPDAGAGPAD